MSYLIKIFFFPNAKYLISFILKLAIIYKNLNFERYCLDADYMGRYVFNSFNLMRKICEILLKISSVEHPHNLLF